MGHNTYNHWIASAAEMVDFKPISFDKHCDLIIIGGGFTGLSAALHAAKLGMQVVVVEANTIGHGGSGRNVGLVNAGLWLPPDDIEKTLGQDKGTRLINRLSNAPSEVFDLIKTFDIQCDTQKSGTIHCAHSPMGLRDLEKRYDQWAKRQAPVEILSKQKVQELTGTHCYYGGLLDKRAGVIQPLDYVRGLARACQSHGVEVFEHSPMRGATYENNQWTVSCDHATVKSKHVLFATNAYGLGAADRHKTSIVHYFQAVSTPLSQEQRSKILPYKHGCWDTAMIMSSFRMTRDNRIAFGAMGQPEGLGGSIHKTWAQRQFRRIFPDCGPIEIDRLWSGRIAITNNKIPKIVSHDNAVSIFGFSGRGIAPGTAMGADIAQWFASDCRIEPALPIQDGYSETMTGFKSKYYETGARAVHFSQR